jgi:hypothetical protein
MKLFRVVHSFVRLRRDERGFRGYVMPGRRPALRHPRESAFIHPPQCCCGGRVCGSKMFAGFPPSPASARQVRASDLPHGGGTLNCRALP